MSGDDNMELVINCNEKPLPCPFCGKEVELEQVEWVFYPPKRKSFKKMVWKCECDDMSFHLKQYKYPEHGRMTFPLYGLPYVQVRKWNEYVKGKIERDARAADRARRTCECGKVYPKGSTFCPNCGVRVVVE